MGQPPSDPPPAPRVRRPASPASRPRGQSNPLSRSNRTEGRGRGRRVGTVALVQLDVAAAGAGAAQVAHRLVSALEPDPEEIIPAGLAVVGHPDPEVTAVPGVGRV